MRKCSAAQPQLLHYYTHLMVHSRPVLFLSCTGPERTHPWNREIQAHKNIGVLPCIWALISGVNFYQPCFLPSSSNPPAIKQILQSKGLGLGIYRQSSRCKHRDTKLGGLQTQPHLCYPAALVMGYHLYFYLVVYIRRRV